MMSAWFENQAEWEETNERMRNVNVFHVNNKIPLWTAGFILRFEQHLFVAAQFIFYYTGFWWEPVYLSFQSVYVIFARLQVDHSWGAKRNENCYGETRSQPQRNIGLRMSLLLLLLFLQQKMFYSYRFNWICFGKSIGWEEEFY